MFGPIFLLVSLILLTIALTPKTVTQPPAAFEDFNFPQVDEGTAQAVYFGENWSNGWMVLALGDFRSEGIEGEDGKK